MCKEASKELLPASHSQEDIDDQQSQCEETIVHHWVLKDIQSGGGWAEQCDWWDSGADYSKGGGVDSDWGSVGESWLSIWIDEWKWGEVGEGVDKAIEEGGYDIRGSDWLAGLFWQPKKQCVGIDRGIGRLIIAGSKF